MKHGDKVIVTRVGGESERAHIEERIRAAPPGQSLSELYVVFDDSPHFPWPVRTLKDVHCVTIAPYVEETESIEMKGPATFTFRGIGDIEINHLQHLTLTYPKGALRRIRELKGS